MLEVSWKTAFLVLVPAATILFSLQVGLPSGSPLVENLVRSDAAPLNLGDETSLLQTQTSIHSTHSSSVDGSGKRPGAETSDNLSMLNRKLLVKPLGKPLSSAEISKVLEDPAFLQNSMIDLLRSSSHPHGNPDTVAVMESLLHKDPVTMAKYKDLMMPVVSTCRYIAIIGNIIIIAVICGLFSIKSQHLLRDGASAKMSATMEKALRRDVTVTELRSHALPGDIWVAVDGMVCDVSDFTTNHPGGADVLLQLAGCDVSEEFAEVGHSAFAVELVKERMVGVLVGGVETNTDGNAPEPGAFVQFARKVLPEKVFSLFTKEDPFHLHKILGITVLGHYIVRFALVVRGDWLLNQYPPGSADPMMFGADWFSLASGWFCILLQASSFQFLLPRNRVAGRPMLWQEWRAHNLIFVLRSLAGFTACWVKLRYNTTPHQDLMIACVLFMCVYAQLYATDVSSRMLRDSKHESLSASWPLWEGCPFWLERFIKFYYSIGINQLTFIVIVTAGNVFPCMYINFAGMVILQSDSLAMTLVRKNIMGTATFHAFYLWNMWHLAFMVLHTQGYLLAYTMGFTVFALGFAVPMFAVPVAVYILRFCGLSKYGCWSGFMAMVFLELAFPDLGHALPLLACPVVWAVWAVAQFLVTGYVFELRVRRFLESGRPKALILKSRDRVTKSLYCLKFELPKGYHCGMMPGQHLRLLAPNRAKDMKTWNGRENPETSTDEISRSYTPISAPNSDTFEIMVRHYAKDEKAGFPHGGRASTYLIDDLPVGQDILASGPHGQRIYFGNGLFEVQVGQPRMKPRACAFLAAGSGITPAISVMREVQAEARRKADVVEASKLMDYENDVSIEVLEVMHLNRMVDDALPLDFYKDPTQSKQLIAINVHNVITGTADPGLVAGSFEEQCDGQCTWSVQQSKLTKAILAEAFPEPADDVLIIICGPHNFLKDTKPLLTELGYKHVISMW